MNNVLSMQVSELEVIVVELREIIYEMSVDEEHTQLLTSTDDFIRKRYLFKYVFDGEKLMKDCPPMIPTDLYYLPPPK